MYKIQVIELFEDYEHYCETKLCRSQWLVTAYKRAFRKRYGDDFRFRVFKV